MKTRRNLKRPRSYAEKDLGSYDSQTEDSDVPWIKKLPTPKKGRKYSSAGRSSRKKTSQNSQNFVSSLDEKECNLYRSVANLKSALKQIVKKFAKKVEEAEEKSLTEITNFFTQTAGSKKYIKVDQIMDGDKDELEEDVTQSYDLSMKQYPLAPDAKGAQAKAINKLSKRLRDFWGKLIQEMSDSEKFDVFMDHCFEWLKCLCKSKQLALRHACSSNAYWIVEGLIAIASPLQDEIEGKEKQLNSTKAKGTKNKLSKDIQDLEGRVQALNEFMKKGFESVFVHRYRDSKPVVRELSLSSLGLWMKSYPTYFLKNDFLKYFGWCLSDEDASVRLAVLGAINELMQDEEKVEVMGSFVERFMPRFLEMVDDRDSAVACRAVETATIFVRNDLLDDDQGSNIPALVWDHNDDVSAAAAEFVLADTFAADEDSEVDTDAKAIDDLKEIVELFKDNYPALEEEGTVVNFPAAVDKLISAIFSGLPLLQDWKLFNETLLSSSTKKKKGRSKSASWEDDQLEIISYILLSSIKVACGVGLKPVKGKKRKKKEEDEIEKNKKRISKLIGKQLPSLLNTYEAEGKTILPLVQLPRYFDLEHYASSESKAFKQTLKALKSVYLKHVDAEILTEIVRTVGCLANGDHDLTEDIEQFITDLSTIVAQQLSDFDLKESAKDPDELDGIKTAVLRLKLLCNGRDCSAAVNMDFKELIKTHLVDVDGDYELGSDLLELEYLCAIWGFLNEEEASETVEHRINFLYETIGHVLASPNTSEKAKRKVCKLAATLFISSINGRIPSPSEGLRENFKSYVASVLEAKEEDSMDLEFVTNIGSLALAYPEFSEISHNLLSYYSTWGGDYTATLKGIMGEMKKLHGPSTLLEAQLGALKQVYKKADEDSKSKDTTDIANKFALLFSFSKNVSFTKLFKDGVEFAVSEGIDFLDCGLLPFVKRASDKQLRDMYRHMFLLVRKLEDEDENKPGVESFLLSIKKLIQRKASSRATMPPPAPINKSALEEKKRRRSSRKKSEQDKENQPEENEEMDGEEEVVEEEEEEEEEEDNEGEEEDEEEDEDELEDEKDQEEEEEEEEAEEEQMEVEGSQDIDATQELPKRRRSKRRRR